jgi:hypothetical protein
MIGNKTTFFYKKNDTTKMTVVPHQVLKYNVPMDYHL